MTTLASLEKKIAQLMKQKEALLKGEAKEAAKKARALIAQFGLTPEDLFGAKARKSVATAAPKKPGGIAKYRDPITGKTWTGQGKPPGWIAAAPDRSPFLIAAGSAAQGTAGSASTNKPVASKAAKTKAAATKRGAAKGMSRKVAKTAANASAGSAAEAAAS